MAKKANTTEEDIIEEVIFSEKPHDKLLAFFETYKRHLAIGTGLLFGVILIGWGYKTFIVVPKQKNAQVQMIRAQQYFEMDSFNLALNGDGSFPGFKLIIDQYGGTPAGNGAKIYAGICALHLGEYQAAIDYLNKFKTSDALLNARKYGCMADAYAELGKMAEAAGHYQKAVDAAPDNEITAPVYYFRLAKSLEATDKKNEAVKVYETLNLKFPDTYEGNIAQKEMARVQAGL